MHAEECTKVQKKALIPHKCTHILSSSYLLIYQTEDGDADLHAQVMQAKDGRLQKEETGNKEEAKSQGQEVSLAPFCSIDWVKRGNDST